ncbi:unnamed protein product [Cuscuta europaea]|uniref:CRM domain-containing protein n=1 Tax=Cuscuta europaea TaxID=41803 RepID=A0A9P0Z2D2_CUSEU|nr:unnamed protein product [Cuscuta europaea]
MIIAFQHSSAGIMGIGKIQGASPYLNFPSPSSSATSQYHYFHNPLHFPTTLRTQIFELYRSSPTTQTEIVSTTPKRKKRKPRSSFLEKIHEKWPLEHTSSWKNIPWQEQNPETIVEQTPYPRLSCTVNRTDNKEEKVETSDSMSCNSKIQELKVLDGEVNSNSEAVKFGGDSTSILTSQKGQILDRDLHLRGNLPTGSVPESNCDVAGVHRGVNVKELGNAKGLSAHKNGLKCPWEGESECRGEEKSGMSYAQLADKSIPEVELKRLRNVALRTIEIINVGTTGITQALVVYIHEKWKEDEIVKLNFVGPLSHNMDRTQEILEAETGGIVICRSGCSIVIYRGLLYTYDYVKSVVKQSQFNLNPSKSSRDLVAKGGNGLLDGASKSYLHSQTEEEKTDLSELNPPLIELGPRVEDWSGGQPLPIDADLLPAVVPGYRPPFRRVLYGVKYNLRENEKAHLRRTAKAMPPHFSLGRNRVLQGLAAAVVKLWERNIIVKIAIKRGVHNTCSERMAEELRVLTGGTLLSRNKEYIVFYRGNDFLVPVVAEALKEAESRNALQQEEEEARKLASNSIFASCRDAKRPFVAGTLAETIAATTHWATQPITVQEREKMMKDAAEARHASLIRFLEQKLAFANKKVKNAEKALRKLQKNLEPSELPIDLETLTTEERFLFIKMGLSMKPYLLGGGPFSMVP